MTPERFRTLSEVVEQALLLPEPERERFVEESCAGDQELVEQVQELLLLDDGRAEEDALLPADLRSWGLDVLAGAGTEDSLPGRLGRYVLDEQLGRGAFGVVHRARDEHLSRDVALKILGQGLVEGEGRQRRFVQEAEILASLTHPHVATIHDIGHDAESGRTYLAMQEVKGRTLRDELDERAPLSVEETCVLASQLADALAVAHEREVIHCDLKPENLMVSQDGRGRPWLTVLDFGLARILDVDETTPRGGTPSYMAPEQWRPEVTVDHRCDLWSFGVLLFECLSGARPFVGEGAALRTAIEESEPDWTLLPEDLPSSLDQVIRRCLAKKPDRRPGSFAELAPVFEDDPVHEEVERRRRTRLRRGVLLGTAGLVLLAIGMAWSTVTTREDVARSHWQADEAEREARLQRLLGASEKVRSEDAMLAALLAREAARIENGPEAREQVAQALAMLPTTPYRALEGHVGHVRQGAWHPSSDRLITAARDGARIWSRDGGASRSLAKSGGEVFFAGWDRSGQRLVTTSQDGQARLWTTEGELVRVFEGQHSRRIHHGAFDPEGERFVGVSYDSTGSLWDVESGRRLRLLEGHVGRVFTCEWSPDGRRLVTAGDDAARLWDRHGSFLTTLPHDGAHVLVARWSPDGERLVTAGVDGTARIWDLEGRELHVLDEHGENVTWADWHPSGDRLATSSEDHDVRTWSREGEELLRLQGHDDAVWHVSWHPDGTLLASFGNDGTARVWDDTGGGVAVLPGHRGWVSGSDWSPDGESLLTVSWDGTARIWSEVEGSSSSRMGMPWTPYHAQWSRDGERVLAWPQWVGEAHLHDLSDGRPTIVRHEGLLGAALHPREPTFMTVSAEGGATVWDFAGRQRRTLPKVEPMTSVSWSPSGRLVAIRTRGQAIVLWSDEGERLDEIAGEELHGFLTWSPEESYLACLDGRGALVWSLEDRRVFRLEGHSGRMIRVAFASEAGLAATGSFDETVRIWDLATGETARVLDHDAQVQDLDWHPDARRLATAAGATARIWERSGELLAELRGHAAHVTAVAWSPEGDRLLTTAQDGTARIWSDEGRLLAIEASHAARLRGGEWSRDGERVMTWSADQSVRIWRPVPLWEQAAREIRRDFTPEERATYLPGTGSGP